MISRCTLVNMKAITDSTINLKTAILVPLALVLTVLVAGSVYTFFDHEKEYNEKYVGATFLSVSRISIPPLYLTPPRSQLHWNLLHGMTRFAAA